jgi:DNA repair protein RecN (Recombination protein N)
LARRYKRTPEELPALYASWKSDLQALERSVDLNALEQADKDAQKAYSTLAAQISAQRGQSAPLLSNAITEAMQGLGMQGGRFLVQIEKALTPSSTGVDEISFLVAAHSGSTPRPVAKVASGGELSRISLAIAVTTSQLGEAQTLIFDEVDSGIGGAVAQTVGRLMKKLGIDRQVLAVTHLPQVAACADHHWVVSKSAGSEGTLSQIHSVEGSERVNEIARMLGGERITEATQAHAKEMLEEAEEGSLGTQKASQVDKKNTRKKVQESKS